MIVRCEGRKGASRDRRTLGAGGIGPVKVGQELGPELLEVRLHAGHQGAQNRSEPEPAEAPGAATEDRHGDVAEGQAQVAVVSGGKALHEHLGDGPSQAL